MTGWTQRMRRVDWHRAHFKPFTMPLQKLKITHVAKNNKQHSDFQKVAEMSLYRTGIVLVRSALSAAPYEGTW